MARTINIRLGDAEYTTPRLNLGQIRDIAAVIGEHPADTAVKRIDMTVRLAEVVLARAEPPLNAITELECTPAALDRAIQAVMAFSGMEGPARGEEMAQSS